MSSGVLSHILLVSLVFMFTARAANALPAFARKENASCTMCHTTGAAPHLNKLGYMYRRMAFHMPGTLGDEKADEHGMNITEHMAVGVNVNYEYHDNTASDGTKTVSANGVNVPEVEVWPLVGGFFGNFGVWSEIDSVPQTNADGGVSVSMADVRYAFGTPELFYNFRAGLIAPEGFGASDQWLDDGNTPLLDQMTPNKIQDSMVTPFGAMQSPQMGMEAGVNYKDSHLTLGLYNGFTDIAVDGTGAISQQPNLLAAKTKHNDQGMRDYRVSLDQFVGEYGAITASYYHGTVPLILPTDATKAWLNHFDQARLYLTAFAIPNRLDILAGGGWMQNEFATTQPTSDGKYTSKAGFVGANYYASPHLVLSGRLDRFNFNSDQSATGMSLQASLPYNNHVIIFHYNHTSSAIASGPAEADWSNDVGVSFRFLL